MTPAQKPEREKLAEEYTKKIWRGGSRPYASAERYSWLDFIAGYEAALKQPKVISFSVGMQGAGGGSTDRTECLSTEDNQAAGGGTLDSQGRVTSTWTATWYERIQKLEKERDTFEARWELLKADNEELEKTQASTDESELVHAVKSLDNSRIQELEHRLSLPKVPQSEETRALTKRILELEAECARLRDAITRVRNAIALGTWNLDERHKNFALEVNKLFESTLEVTNG